jgi:hypothetical protein
VTHEELEAAAQRYEEAATELARGAGHCRVAAERYRAVEQPSGAAHALAARGHVLEALVRLDENARLQARKSLLPGDAGYG